MPNNGVFDNWVSNTKSLLPKVGSTMGKIISFSLFGSRPKYTHGAVNNVIVCKDLYPDFVCRFYIANDVPREIVCRLIEEGAEIVMRNERSDNRRGSFWRYCVAFDPSVDIFLCRDCDSTPSFREVDAVNQWLESEKMVHIMRDHSSHWRKKILGGMWGAKRNWIDLVKFGVILEKYYSHSRSANYGYDETMLDDVYGCVKNVAMIHDDAESNASEFRVKINGGNFVGKPNCEIPKI